MYRAQSRMKKSLQEKWNNRLDILHMERLCNAKPRIDMKNPFQFKHLSKKCKKEQLLEDRFTEIERANRILLERLTRIMQTRREPFSNPPAAVSFPRRQKSLNRSSRKKELVKITSENQALLKRLQTKKSHYNVTQWNKDHKERTKMLQNMCEYPYQFARSPRHLPQIVRANYESEGYNPGATSYMTQYPPKSSQRRAKSGRSIGDIKQIEKPVLCKKRKKLAEQEYDVELALTKGRMLLSAASVSSPETIVVDIPPEKSKQILKVFRGNYELLLDKLQIVDNKLMIIAPTEEETKQIKEQVIRKDSEEDEGPDASGVKFTPEEKAARTPL